MWKLPNYGQTWRMCLLSGGWPRYFGTMLTAVTEGDCEQPLSCITEHPGFLAVCTNKWVLRTAWFQYKQQYQNAYEGPEHKQYRHVAYRQFVRWCWGFLGKDIRVVLPSCAVMCIRAHFPPPGLEDDFVFEGFHFADEWTVSWITRDCISFLKNKISLFAPFVPGSNLVSEIV